MTTKDLDPSRPTLATAQGHDIPHRPRRIGARASQCRADLPGGERCQLVDAHENTFNNHITVDADQHRVWWNSIVSQPRPVPAVLGRRIPWALGFPAAKAAPANQVAHISSRLEADAITGEERSAS